MTEFRSPIPLPAIPDDLTIPQFILNADFSRKPHRPSNVPYFIDDRTSKSVDFLEAHRRTYGLANALSLKWAIGQGDVVCLFSPNHIDYGVVIWAVHTLGGIITPANPQYTTDELAYQLTITKSALIIVHRSSLNTARSAVRIAGISDDRIVVLDEPLAPPVADAIITVDDLIKLRSSSPEKYSAQRLKPGEARTRLAFLSFSSGTTGKPKAVAISHYSVIANVIQMAVHHRIMDPSWPEIRMGPGDRVLAVLPFFHIYGLVVILHYSLFSGMTLVVTPKFSLPAFLKSIVHHRITHLYVVPPQVVLLCKHPSCRTIDFSRIKLCISGAAPLSGELVKQLSNVLPNAAIGQGYGLTETCTTVCMLPPEHKIGTIGSAGRLLPGVTARVVKPDGSLAVEGEQGELVVSGPSMALRYFNNDDATKETFTDGWVHTGDEVIIKKLDVFVVDRLKEIMKVRGFQVAPAELEGHLLLHPDIVDACVVGVPDEYSGEVPLAYVVLSAKAFQRIGTKEREAIEIKKDILKHVSDAKVPYKWLAGGVEFIEAIPKNPSGKILRRLLRDKAKIRSRAESQFQAKL